MSNSGSWLSSNAASHADGSPFPPSFFALRPRRLPARDEDDDATPAFWRTRCTRWPAAASAASASARYSRPKYASNTFTGSRDSIAAACGPLPSLNDSAVKLVTPSSGDTGREAPRVPAPRASFGRLLRVVRGGTRREWGGDDTGRSLLAVPAAPSPPVAAAPSVRDSSRLACWRARADELLGRADEEGPAVAGPPATPAAGAGVGCVVAVGAVPGRASVLLVSDDPDDARDSHAALAAAGLPARFVPRLDRAWPLDVAPWRRRRRRCEAARSPSSRVLGAGR